jgi:uncharacterized membrane protein YGL010W
VWYTAVLFAVGATLHTIGHTFFEHKPPSIFSNPIAVVEAPAWLIAIVIGWRPQRGVTRA